MEWFSSEYKQATVTFISPTLAVTRKRANSSDIIDGSHDEIRPNYQYKFDDRGISRTLPYQAWNQVLEKCNDYTEYPMLGKQNRVTGKRINPVTSKRIRDNMTPGADTNFNATPETADDDEDWNLNGAIGEESTQRSGVKRRPHGL